MAKPITGQAVCTGANNSIPLSASPVQSKAFVIKAKLTNSAAIAIGKSDVTLTTGHLLDPGEEFVYQRSEGLTNAYPLEPSDFYTAGANLDTVSWLASP